MQPHIRAPGGMILADIIGGVGLSNIDDQTALGRLSEQHPTLCVAVENVAKVPISDIAASHILLALRDFIESRRVRFTHLSTNVLQHHHAEGSSERRANRNSRNQT